MAPHPETRPLRIAYVLKRFPRLSETFILNELLALERQGVAVEVYSLMRPPQEARHDLLAQLRAPVFYLPRSRALEGFKLQAALSGRLNDADQPLECASLAGLARQWDDTSASLLAGKSDTDAALLWLQAATVAFMAASRGIQHLHAHFGSNAALVALLAGRQSRLPFSFTAHARDIYHTYVDRQTDDQRRRDLIHEAAFVATVSDYNRQHLRQLADPADRERIMRLYNGIDLARFQPLAERQPSNHFVAVGRLVEKKGYPDLIRACALLAERQPLFRLSIVGDGPEREVLQQQVAEAGLQRQVLFHGALTQQQVIALIADAAALVLPCVVCDSGDRDGLPTALLEAMALGLATISTRVAGVPEIIDDGKTGILVEQRQPRSLASAMEHLLLHPERQLSLGQAGRAKAQRLFDLERNVAELGAQFQRSAGTSQAGGQADAYRLHCG
ncbi:glycosyltransferase [Motiliproteus sediminis]|uniref:glycosyltransferase n=1 Tax=Motiliproteus sediminis TaxID=1468178 RepID=UPI001AEFF10C|nr:glycosyltransferase [Motiliproteus sediminis]